MAEGGSHPIPTRPARWMHPVMGQGLVGPRTPRWPGPGPGLSTCRDPALGPAGRSAAPHQSPRPSDSLKINLLQRFPRSGARPCSCSGGSARREAQRGPGPERSPEHFPEHPPGSPAGSGTEPRGREGSRSAALGAKLFQGNSKPFLGRREPGSRERTRNIKPDMGPAPRPAVL